MQVVSSRSSAYAVERGWRASGAELMNVPSLLRDRSFKKEFAPLLERARSRDEAQIATPLILREIQASQRIDFELLSKGKYPRLLEEFLQVLYEISNDATAKAEAEEPSVEGKRPATRKVHGDAKTGRFVSKQYTKEHPDTTVTETVE